MVGLGGSAAPPRSIWPPPGSGSSPCSISTLSRSPNLQRQTLHSDATLGQPKVDSAREALARINPHVRLVPLNALLDEAALAAQIADHDLVLDCTDNVAIRNQLNVGCFQHKPHWSPERAIRMEGQISVFTYQDGEPCYRCLSRLFGENALTCVEAGGNGPAGRHHRFAAGDGGD
ncbi:molybdopterin biosynthesis protein MoeB [Klebsiella pneumoniae]|uniref:Molybdopterin biosynthesis protein MoeB n=1 Tax=Klebsiella pneumoniae TaxID=573 RepID=A0A2X1SSK9_KLEPN|nr:molybdopterin biosynthesis protein MoeB [Klebsiella pneumoniae]